jgi:heme-degrading monooxygenase HmoA
VLVVLFRSRLAPEAGADYHAMADEMLERARAMPGFVDFTHYAAPDGERLAVVRWQDEATLAAWRSDERHRLAQRLGRERWYRWFSLEVAEIVRAYDFERDR